VAIADAPPRGDAVFSVLLHYSHCSFPDGNLCYNSDHRRISPNNGHLAVFSAHHRNSCLRKRVSHCSRCNNSALGATRHCLLSLLYLLFDLLMKPHGFSFFKWIFRIIVGWFNMTETGFFQLLFPVQFIINVLIIPVLLSCK